MSAGGVFKLLANDGKADRMIMATELLNSRIRDIMCARSKAGFPDPTPTLVDIERTHVLFVNSHFKPFAAIGYEYNKTRANTGTATFGNGIQFSIPQFGDFFSDMVVNVTLEATSATVGTVPDLPAFVGALDQGYLDSAGVFSSSVPATTYGKVSGKENATTGVYTSYTHQYVDIAGTPLAVGAAAKNYVRYCEYPGQRLFKKVKFDVNGNPLDDYTTEATVFHRDFCVQPNKQTGWKRLHGQEVPIEAFSDIITASGLSSYPAAASNLLDVNNAAVPGSAVSATITARKMFQLVSGFQTPKETQPVCDMFIPLLFWFNKDTRLAIASISIPYGQRFISIDLEAQNNILFVAPGNLFLRLTTEQTTSAGTAKGTKLAQAVESYKKWSTLTPTLATGSVIDSNQRISCVELYINNIFVNPEIHDIFIHRIGFSLIRVHRFQTDRRSESTGNILLSQLKWPIETIYLGMRPTENISAANPNQYRDWHRLHKVEDEVINVTSSAHSKVAIDDSVAFSSTGGKIKSTESQEVVERIVVPKAVETIDSLQMQAHGINIFQSFKSAFFRDYMPYTFGGNNIVTPEDVGALMLNFCLYPGLYQPSGHINASRTRELYVSYISSQVSPSAPADLVVLGRAINFLLITDGSAILRYST